MRAALLAALLAPPASAATGAQTLRRPLSARVAALAESYAAAGGGLSSLGLNPAGLAAARRPQLESSFMSGILDDSFGWLGWAQPLPAGTAAAGLAYYDAGKVELAFSNGTRATRTAARDFVGVLGWAMPLGAGVSAGAALKAFRFELAQEAKASGAAADAGLRWETPLRGLTAGAAVQNAGPAIKFEEEKDPLPLTFRGGLSWTYVHAPKREVDSSYSSLRLTFSADGIKTRDERALAALGTECGMDFAGTSAALRMGWTFNQDSAGPTFGAGLSEGRFTLDYALATRRDLGNTHHLTLGARF